MQSPPLFPFSSSIARAFSPFLGASTGGSLPHVADAPARLSLLGISPGYQVIQDDNSTTYGFQGAGADSDAGLLVTGAGASDTNGSYTFNGTDTYTSLFNGTLCVFAHAEWEIGTGQYIGDGSTYAWQSAFWTIVGGDPPAPTVARNPIASEANWSVV